MHYRNGRPARVGDRVVTRDYLGNPQAGIVAFVAPKSETCNLTIYPLRPADQSSATARDCLHVDDALAWPSGDEMDQAMIARAAARYAALHPEPAAAAPRMSDSGSSMEPPVMSDPH